MLANGRFHGAWFVAFGLIACGPGAELGGATESGTGDSSSTGTTDPTRATTGGTRGPTTVDPDSSTATEPPPTSTTGTTDPAESSSTGVEGCQGRVGPAGYPGVNLPHIWIANSPESTISRIDTESMLEVGRYQTDPGGQGNPSRTSVSLSGHVAVANRSGGVTKYYGVDCPNPIATSTGPDDVYTFSADGCFAWHTPMDLTTQRPVAWAPGVYNEETCLWEDELLWSSGGNGGGTTVEVFRYDGETGSLLDTVAIPEVISGSFGPYGGAVDGNGDFWFSQLGADGQNLVRVDAEDLDYEVFIHTIAGYGITVDPSGRPWICGYDGQLARFDPSDSSFTYAQTGAAMYGCSTDEDYLWVGGNTAELRGIDLETFDMDHVFLLDTDSTDIHGTSVDYEGNIWAVERGNSAARVDPSTGTIDYVAGLNLPYTYSDMTGRALANVAD